VRGIFCPRRYLLSRGAGAFRGGGGDGGAVVSDGGVHGRIRGEEG